LEIREAAYSANPNHPNTFKAAQDLVQAYLLEGDRSAAERTAADHNLNLVEMERKAEEIKRAWTQADHEKGLCDLAEAARLAR
jgi:hypothetical protein